jgi:hypothetical protein
VSGGTGRLLSASSLPPPPSLLAVDLNQYHSPGCGYAYGQVSPQGRASSMSNEVGLIVLLFAVLALIALDVLTGHKFGDKLRKIVDSLFLFVILVAIVAGIGWGIWKAGAWVFTDEGIIKHEEAYEEGYYDALDCVKRKGGSASTAVDWCR